MLVSTTAHLSTCESACASRATNVQQLSIRARNDRRRATRLPLAAAAVAASSLARLPQHPAPPQRQRRQPVAASASKGGDSGSTGGSGSAASPGGPHGPAWLREQDMARRAAWEELAPEERTWLQAQNAALAMQPATKEAAKEQQRLLHQCDDDWNNFPPASQWRTAWADLLPQQQREQLEQHGVSSWKELLPAICAEHTSLPKDLRGPALQQLPPPAARLRIAAVKNAALYAFRGQRLARKAAWASLAPDERRWLEAQEAAAAAKADSEKAAEQQRQQLQQLEEEWHAFAPDSRWRTAWADLIPAQQQQLLAQVGAGSMEEFVPALAALPTDQQASMMGGLTVPQQRVLAAAAGLQQAAGEGMQPDQLLWLQSLTTARSAQPATQQVNEQAAAIAAQLDDQWNALPADKQWATAWATLPPSQQRQLLAKYGANDADALLPAAAAALAGVEPSQRSAWLTQLPAPEAQLLVAAAKVQKKAVALQAEQAQREAGWAALGEDERQWLQAQAAVVAAARRSGMFPDPQGLAPPNFEKGDPAHLIEMLLDFGELLEQWKAWPADKQWATAWADLLPSQQRQLLAKYGEDGPLSLRDELGKRFGAFSKKESKKALAGLPPWEAQVMVAAANWHRAQQR